MEAVTCTIKMNTNNAVLMDKINKIVPVLQQSGQQFTFDTMHNNMTNFEKAMDEIQVSANIMDGVLNKNQDV